ncbi:MAG: tRNA pseudouridine(38-40) synthase TruA [Actinomycetota bacterium]|nr:tRNA pseudouridine(38-40) synthase TruA [Actinomycetota bacterium]
MTTYRIDLAYDGTGFYGYARQDTVRTVQGELEAALLPFTGPVATYVAGRTDRGVHAAGQVVSLTTDVEVDTARVVRSLNRRLGPEISVATMVAVPDGFHARFSAVGRAYRYLVIDGDTPDPFLARFAWHLGHRLDVGAMDRAAAVLIGEHDFASFCRQAGERSTVRLVRTARWERYRPDLVAFTVEASSFCHQMVRSVVATCARIGRGAMPVESMADVLAGGDRALTPGPAPPHGLTLLRVDYGRHTSDETHSEMRWLRLE